MGYEWILINYLQCPKEADNKWGRFRLTDEPIPSFVQYYSKGNAAHTRNMNGINKKPWRVL